MELKKSRQLGNPTSDELKLHRLKHDQYLQARMEEVKNRKPIAAPSSPKGRRSGKGFKIRSSTQESGPSETKYSEDTVTEGGDNNDGKRVIDGFLPGDHHKTKKTELKLDAVSPTRDQLHPKQSSIDHVQHNNKSDMELELSSPVAGTNKGRKRSNQSRTRSKRTISGDGDGDGDATVPRTNSAEQIQNEAMLSAERIREIPYLDRSSLINFAAQDWIQTCLGSDLSSAETPSDFISNYSSKDVIHTFPLPIDTRPLLSI